MAVLERLRRLARVLAVLALASAPAQALAAPDMTKVIREVFPVAETGFDPAAVHDLYSATIVQGLFETLYTYDYLARPAKVVPLAADGMPVVTDEGRTWTVKLKKGIRFVDDPAFGGKPRELVGRRLRVLVQAADRPAHPLALVVPRRGQVRGPGRTGRRGEGSRPLRLRQADRRPRGGRPAHDPLPPQGHRLQPPVHPRARADLRGRARGDREVRRVRRPHAREPGRHRPVQARALGAQLEDHPRGEPGPSRLHLGLQGAGSRATTRWCAR